MIFSKVLHSPTLVVLEMVEGHTKQLPLDMPGLREQDHMLTLQNTESLFLYQSRREH